MYFKSYLVQIKLLNVNSTLSASNNRRFAFPNLYNYQSMNIIGMALNGFDISTINNINFSLQPTYSFTNNTFIITMFMEFSSNPINLLTYTVMVYNSMNSDLFDLQNPCFYVFTQAIHPKIRTLVRLLQTIHNNSV